MGRQHAQQLSAFALVLLLAAAPARAGDAGEGERRDWVFIPALGYSSDTELMGGAMLMRLYGCRGDRNGREEEGCRPSNVALSLRYSQRHQVVAALEGEHWGRGSCYHLSWRVDYRRFPSTFYGVGRDASLDGAEDYTPEGGGVACTLYRRLYGAWELGLHVRGGRRRYLELEAGGRLAGGTPTGSRGYDFGGLGPVLRYDSRDSRWWPRRGLFCSFSSTLYRRALGGDLDWRRSDLDLRAYRELGILGVVALQCSVGLAQGEAPFDRLPALGGDETLRGYPDSRWRDRSRALAQLELRRSSLLGPLGLAIFGGLGDVAPRAGALRPLSARLAGGLGLRYLYEPASSLHLRFDLGWGEGGETGITMAVGEAF